MRRTVLLTTIAAILFSSVPALAFEVQSGGVLLSPQTAAVIANRLAGADKRTRHSEQELQQRSPAQQPGQGMDNMALPPWLGEASNDDADPRRRLLGLMFGDSKGTERKAGGERAEKRQ